MAINAGKENIKKASIPPVNDDVAYIEIAVSSWVDVGPGKDWQMVSSSTNFSSLMLNNIKYTNSCFKLDVFWIFLYDSLALQM